MTSRWIAHLDMDAFYASVELLRYPQLRGRPVVVGGRRRAAENDPADAAFSTLRGYTGRGVITTSTYEARALGVFSGMGLMKAAKLAPDAILLPEGAARTLMGTTQMQLTETRVASAGAGLPAVAALPAVVADVRLRDGVEPRASMR